MTLEVLLQKSSASFEESLALGEVGLPKHLDDETYKRTCYGSGRLTES